MHRKKREKRMSGPPVRGCLGKKEVEEWNGKEKRKKTQT